MELESKVYIIKNGKGKCGVENCKFKINDKSFQVVFNLLERHYDSEHKLTMSNIIDILNNCENCSSSECCQSCDVTCDEHKQIHDRLYQLYDEMEED